MCITRPAAACKKRSKIHLSNLHAQLSALDAFATLSFTHSVIKIDRIVKKSESCVGVKIGDCTLQRLLFVGDLVLLDSTQNGLQQAFYRFSNGFSESTASFLHVLGWIH